MNSKCLGSMRNVQVIKNKIFVKQIVVFFSTVEIVIGGFVAKGIR